MCEKYKAYVNDEKKTVKLLIKGKPMILLKFDEERWNEFYDFILEVNNTLSW
jgi:hypothetical protein